MTRRDLGIAGAGEGGCVVGLVLGLGLALATLAGCGEIPTFECDFDIECGIGGLCADEGYCAFPDLACPSTFRFDESAREDLANTCVDPGSITFRDAPASR